MRLAVLVIPLLISFNLLAQSNTKNEGLGRRYKRWERKYDKLDPFVKPGTLNLYRASCEEAKNIAREKIRNDSIIYLIDSSLITFDKRNMLMACVLKQEFNIAPDDSFFPCREDEIKRLTAVYQSYNCVIDSFLSVKYNTDFSKLLLAKVDTASTLPKEEIIKHYPFMRYYRWPRK